MGYREHYDKLLAHHYSWMSGPFAAKVATETARLTELGIGPTRAGSVAVDLGCGPGYQAIALADAGFARVLALDTSAVLLDELRAKADDRPIDPVELDILRIGDHVAAGSADCVSCMGDTLTHLESRDAVTALFRAVRTALMPAGTFVVSYRDLTQARSGVDRFLMPRADADRILTCFLEPIDADVVRVHDIVHQRAGDGWTMQVSAYPKLRLAPDWIAAQMSACGLTVESLSETGGFVVIAAKRASADRD